jgi:predicted ABC-class ATPase
LEQLETTNELNALGWVWFQFAQQPGWSKLPAKDIERYLSDDWYTSMPNQGDLAKPRVLDVLAALNRMRKSQFRPSK